MKKKKKKNLDNIEKNILLDNIFSKIERKKNNSTIFLKSGNLCTFIMISFNDVIIQLKYNVLFI